MPLGLPRLFGPDVRRLKKEMRNALQVHKFLDRKSIRSAGLLIAPGLQTHAGTASKFAKFWPSWRPRGFASTRVSTFLGGSWPEPKFSTANYSWQWKKKIDKILAMNAYPPSRDGHDADRDLVYFGPAGNPIKCFYRASPHSSRQIHGTHRPGWRLRDTNL